MYLWKHLKGATVEVSTGCTRTGRRKSYRREGGVRKSLDVCGDLVCLGNCAQFSIARALLDWELGRGAPRGEAG